MRLPRKPVTLARTDLRLADLPATELINIMQNGPTGRIYCRGCGTDMTREPCFCMAAN